VSTDIYSTLTDKIFMTGSKIIPELFRMIASQEEAELMLAMPGTPAQLSEKVGKSPEEVEDMCLELYRKGLAFKSFKGGEVAFKMCREIIQFHDATILWQGATREYHDLWQRFIDVEWPDFARIFTEILPRPFTRIIPVEKALDAGNQQILDIDSASRIIEEAEVVAVTNCTCRTIARKCDNPLEVCLQVNNSARYTIDRGSGREISKQEAIDILNDCEAKGLVHVTNNKAHAGHFICNCCSCCCQALPLMISEGLKINDPSRYRAVIDQGLCTACTTCLDRCVFNAIEEIDNPDGTAAMHVMEEKCVGCGVCYPTCPVGAIALMEVRPVEFIPE